jgi:hypothetical protein
MNKILTVLIFHNFYAIPLPAQNNADSLLSFIAGNKSRSSVYLVEK